MKRSHYTNPAVIASRMSCDIWPDKMRTLAGCPRIRTCEVLTFYILSEHLCRYCVHKKHPFSLEFITPALDQKDVAYSLYIKFYGPRHHRPTDLLLECMAKPGPMLSMLEWLRTDHGG
jgi:hypothetical protein